MTRSFGRGWLACLRKVHPLARAHSLASRSLTALYRHPRARRCRTGPEGNEPDFLREGHELAVSVDVQSHACLFSEGQRVDSEAVERNDHSGLSTCSCDTEYLSHGLRSNTASPVLHLDNPSRRLHIDAAIMRSPSDDDLLLVVKPEPICNGILGLPPRPR